MTSTLLDEPATRPIANSTNAAQRLRATMIAVRVGFTWFGTRKTLTPEQKSETADTFGAEGQFLSAGKKLLETRHPAFKAVSSIRGGRFYKLELGTPAGLLHVSVYGDWVACRFDDVDLGKRFTHSCDPACNPHSGKWNFIYGFSGPFEPEESLADFRRHLQRLMNWQAAAA